MAIGALLFQSKVAVTVADLPVWVGCYVICSIQPRFVPTEVTGASAQTRPASDKGLSHPVAQSLQSALAYRLSLQGQSEGGGWKAREPHPTPQAQRFTSF